MKKILTVLIALCVVFAMCACAASPDATESAEQNASVSAGPTDGEAPAGKPLKIAVTIFPVYDWLRNLTSGTNATLTLLQDSGADLHSYQPTADDIIAIDECDVFVFIGGESDEWTERVLENADPGPAYSVDLIAALGELAKEEELKEGMDPGEHDHDHEEEDHEHEEEDHDHEEEEHDHDHEEHETDEHIWLSLKNAAVLVSGLEDTLAEADPANAAVYRKNGTAYREKLKALDEKYASAVAAASKKTILCADRFPFRYLVDDYGLDYAAAFLGCSAETECGFDTIVFLSEKLNTWDLSYVLTLEGSDQKVAKTVIDNANKPDVEILTLDSLQSVTGAAAQDADYLAIMEQNLTVLQTALG